MTFLKKIYSFFNNISSVFRKKKIPALELTEETEPQSLALEEIKEEDLKISLEKRNLTTKLYILEQEIEIFKNDFKLEYEGFLKRIENLRQIYDSILVQSKENLTFEVNPEENIKLSYEITKLDKEIRMFIDKDVSFEILSKRFQNLIVKLNILYNSSISYPNETEKAMAQVEVAIKKEFELVAEFKDNDYIFSDIQNRENFVTLISYVDYELFKIILRNSKNIPNEVVSNLALAKEFDKFDYILAFSTFLKDELSNLSELLDLLTDKSYRNFFETQINNLFKGISINQACKENFMSRELWDEVFELESSLIKFLKNQNSSYKTSSEIKILDRFNIEVSKSEVLTSAKANAYLTLTKVYSKTLDDKIFLLIKFFENVNEEITYKEIYYLLLLFESIEIVQNNSKTLNNYLDKYISKYSYTKNDMEKKKSMLINSNKTYQYIKAIVLDEEFEKFVNILKQLNIDFRFKDNTIYINSFYFQGLNSVFLNQNCCYS